MNNNNPWGSKTHLGGIDFETVRQFIQCDINLRNGVNIGNDLLLTQSERDFLSRRGMDPHNIDNISEYTRLRSLALFDIEQRKKPVEEVVPEIKRKEMKTIGEYSIVNDRLNNKWLLHGLIGEPILDVFTPVSYERYVNRHAKVMDILTASEYKLLISGDPLAFDSETMKKYFSIIRKLIKSGIYDDSEDVNENIPDENTEETEPVKTETDGDAFLKDIFDSIEKNDVSIYAVKEKVQENTPFGKIEVDKYVFKAYDKNGNEIDDYPLLPLLPIIKYDENEGVVFTADGRMFPIKK
jgi:hypothetical protein